MVLCWDMRSLHSIRAALVALAVARPETRVRSAAAGAGRSRRARRASRSSCAALPIGNEQIALTRSAERLVHRQLRDALARRSTSSRGVCRCATRRTGGRSDMTIDAPSADRPHTIRTVVDGTPAKTRVHRTSAQPGKDRSDRPGRGPDRAEPFFSPHAGAGAAAEDGDGRRRDSRLQRPQSGRSPSRVGESSAAADPDHGTR